MGIWSKFISVMFMLAAGFALGYHTAATSEANAPIITVKFVNASGKKIDALTLLNDNKTIKFKNIEDGTSQTAKFYAPKETSYRIQVDFDDGNLLDAGPRFVQSGLNAVEKIEEHEIKPDFNANVGRIVREAQ